MRTSQVLERLILLQAAPGDTRVPLRVRQKWLLARAAQSQPMEEVQARVPQKETQDALEGLQLPPSREPLVLPGGANRARETSQTPHKDGQN